MGLAWLVALLGLGATGSARAQPATVPLPADIKVETPAADVPRNVALFAGAWGHGAWNGVLPHVLVVESVDGAGRAQIVYHDAFVQAGGVATFHLFPAFGGDGHRLVDRVEIWKRAAEDFLRGLNLTSR